MSSLVKTIGDADQRTLVPAIRGRIQRLRWLYEYVEEQGSLGVSSDRIRSEMMAEFGLTARTVNDYIETLAAQRFIVRLQAATSREAPPLSGLGLGDI